MNRRTLFPLVALLVALALLAACLLALSDGESVRAAPLRQGTGEDLSFRALTVTADLPVSDTHPHQAVTKTVYFNNGGPGIITLTVDLTGTPPLTLTAGAAFAEGERTYTSTDSPATFVVTYEVGTDAGDQSGVLYTATDQRGLEVTVAITYIRDITAPAAAVVNPNADIWISTTLQITGTASDNEGGAGVAAVSVTIGTAWVPAEGISPWIYAWTPSTSQNGAPYTFSVRAADFVGNVQSLAATRRITVDNVMTGTVSGLTSTTHLTGVWSNRTTITVTWSHADDSPGIGLDKYAVLWDLSPLTVPSLTQHLIGPVNELSRTLDEGDSHYFHIRAVDGLGNWADATVHLGPFKIDTTPPGVTLTHPAHGALLTTTHRPTATLIVTATDARSGVAWVDVKADTTWVSTTLGVSGWTWDWGLPEVDRQVYTLTAQAYDNAGNAGLSADVPVTVDTVAPASSTPQPHRSPWVTSTVIYTWPDSTDRSGILGYWVNITNTAGYTTFFWVTSPPLTLSELSEGKGYYARVRAVDCVGNVGDWNGPSTVVTPDLTPPSIFNPQISVGSGVTYFYVSDLTLFYTNTMPTADSFTVKGNATDGGPSGLEKATFSQAFGQTPVTDTSPAVFSGSYDVSSGATESGNITVTIYDKAGNTATQVYTYTLDGEGPYTGSVAVQGPEYISSPTVGLALFAADAGCGVARMCLSNAPSCSNWESYTTTRSWILEGADGEKTVYVWFRDYLGNASGPYTDTVVLDHLPPTGGIIINDGAAYAIQVMVTLTLTAADGTSGLAEAPMRFSNDGATWSTWEAFTTTKVWTLDNSVDGRKTVYVQYRDKANNFATYSDTIMLDRRPPAVTVTVPPTSPVPFIVAWEGEDLEPGSGVVSYSVAYSVTEWVVWFPSTTLTSATFYTATPGQTVVFRVNAYDRAGNVGTDYARVYVDYHRVYIPLVLRNWVWWYQYDRYEPNDTPAQAYGPLSSGQVITAYIWDATDRDDYYWFQPSQSAPVTITLTNIPASCDFDLYVYYYQNGWQTAAQSNKSGNVDEEVRFNATANTKYYIRVYPYQGSSNTQSYRLSVRW